MKNTINLTEKFKADICSFEMAKKATEHGMTCANTYLAYNEDGKITTGGWMQRIPQVKVKMYPAINLPFAIVMLDNLPGEGMKNEIECWEEDGSYFIKYKDDFIKSDNFVDALVALWTKHTPKIQG